MIPVTRLDGSIIVINADLIETVEHNGDTVITLVSGTKFVVRETVEALTDAVVRFRAGVLRITADAAGAAGFADEGGNVIPLLTLRRSTED